MDKPSKFWGKASEWKDWSEAFQAFCEVADAGLGDAMKRYAKCEDPVVFDAMSAADQKERAKWLKALRAATAAATRRAHAASGDGDAPEEEPPAESAFSSALRYIGFAK